MFHHLLKTISQYYYLAIMSETGTPKPMIGVQEVSNFGKVLHFTWNKDTSRGRLDAWSVDSSSGVQWIGTPLDHVVHF
jgi:hypothetical protein